MPSNIELKLRVPNLCAIKKRVADVSKKQEPDGVLHQEDTFFKGAHGRLKLRVENGQQEGCLIQYERDDMAEAKFSDYVKVMVPDASLLKEVLTRAYGVLGEIKKRRELWLIGQTRVHIDDVDDLGSFVEFEVMMNQDQSIAEGQVIANSLLRELELTECDKISGAYLDLKSK